MNARENSEPIPTDLIIEILSRLPAKTIARFRCVSKPWSSMLRRPDFTELFLTKSLAKPHLLFACENNSELLFFSSPNVRNPNENSSIIAADFHMKFPFDNDCSEYCGSVHGLVMLTHLRKLKGRNDTVPLMCNLSTRQSLHLPKVITKRLEVDNFVGYDPVNKEFKLLSISSVLRVSEEHQVLTLGTQKPSWRMVNCGVAHNPLTSGICVNGVLYYIAAIKRSPWVSIVVSFDVRTERFRFIEKDEYMVMLIHSALVNYKGKLAAVMSDDVIVDVNGETRCFEMWVLEDAEKHVWSKHVYIFPPTWKNVVGDAMLFFVGVTSTNEVMLSPRYVSNPFYVFYYNLENKTVRRVEIKGMDAFETCRVHISVDHVEDVKLMDSDLDFIT